MVIYIQILLLFVLTVASLFFTANTVFTTYKLYKEIVCKHKKSKTEINTYDNSVEKENEEDILVKEAQLYDIEKFKKRMRDLRLQQETDEDGLYDYSGVPTKEELGFVTGTEIGE